MNDFKTYRMKRKLQTNKWQIRYDIWHGYYLCWIINTDRSINNLFDGASKFQGRHKYCVVIFGLMFFCCWRELVLQTVRQGIKQITNFAGRIRKLTETLSIANSRYAMIKCIKHKWQIIRTSTISTYRITCRHLKCQKQWNNI